MYSDASLRKRLSGRRRGERDLSYNMMDLVALRLRAGWINAGGPQGPLTIIGGPRTNSGIHYAAHLVD